MFICDGEKEYESNVRMTPSTGNLQLLFFDSTYIQLSPKRTKD